MRRSTHADSTPGVAEGALELENPDLAANLLWTQVLGAMHLARITVGIGRSEAGEPVLFPISAEEVIRGCVDAGLAAVQARVDHSLSASGAEQAQASFGQARAGAPTTK